MDNNYQWVTSASVSKCYLKELCFPPSLSTPSSIPTSHKNPLKESKETVSEILNDVLRRSVEEADKSSVENNISIQDSSKGPSEKNKGSKWGKIGSLLGGGATKVEHVGEPFKS